MARNTSGFFDGELAVLRAIPGVIAADSATLTDANFPVAAAISCDGLDTIFLGVEITAGTAPTATLELLFRDADAPDGSRWKRLLLGATPGITALAAVAAPTTAVLAQNSDLQEIRCFGAKVVYVRVTAVTNATSTTNLNILGMPGQRRPARR